MFSATPKNRIETKKPKIAQDDHHILVRCTMLSSPSVSSSEAISETLSTLRQLSRAVSLQTATCSVFTVKIWDSYGMEGWNDGMMTG